MCARDDTRKKYGITHVVTCVSLYEESFPPDPAEVKSGHWHVIRLADAATSDLLSHLEDVTTFVKTAIDSGGTVAIHSLEGVSRAASICIAFLMKHRSKSLREAFDEVAERRPDVRVNRGFWRQLHAYEFYVKGKNSIEEADLPGAIIFEVDAMASIIGRFKAKHPVPLIANPSPRKVSAIKNDAKAALTGGAFCGSPRKSKQPHTPKLHAAVNTNVANEPDEFALTETSSPPKKRARTEERLSTLVV